VLNVGLFEDGAKEGAPHSAALVTRVDSDGSEVVVRLGLRVMQTIAALSTKCKRWVVSG
jgi:hypothetical protein